MEHGGWKFAILIMLSRAIWFVLPHKYPVPGTKVRVRSYTHRRGWSKPAPLYDGEVISPEYKFVGPFEKNVTLSRPGVYLAGDPRWQHNYVVRLNDEKGTLEQQHLVRKTLVTGYHWGVPLLHWLVSPHMRGGYFTAWRRIRDLPHEIEFYEGDYVICTEDASKTPRMVTAYWFDRDGTVTYSLAETLAERKAKHKEAEEEARRTGRSFATRSGPMMKYHLVPSSSLSLVRRGNDYHLVHGKPEDLSFPHVILEVDFWKDHALWMENVPDLSIEEARDALRSGKVDVVNTGRERKFAQIHLPQYLARFRERSRKASLEYLEKFPGKYSFDVVPTEVREEYEQTDF